LKQSYWGAALVLTFMIVASPFVSAAPEILNHIVDVSQSSYSITQSTDNFYNFVYSNENVSENFYDKLSENIRFELELGENQTFNVFIRLLPADLTEVSKENVISTLKEHANRTQAPILEFLRGENSIVLDNFWLANAIFAEVSENTLLKLASFPSIWRIHEDFKLAIEQAPPWAPPKPGTEIYFPRPDLMWGLEKIRSPEVQTSLGINGAGVRVAVLDTGVQLGVGEGLDSKLCTDDTNNNKYPGGWIEFDSAGNIVTNSTPHDSSGNDYVDAKGHGTHVSATIVGDSVGVAPGASLMSALCYQEIGFEDVAYLRNIIKGMQWAAEPYDVNHNPAGQAANVVVISSGLDGYYAEFEEQIKNLKEDGIVTISSVGNHGLNHTEGPSNIYESLAVGAINRQNEVCSAAVNGFDSAGGYVTDSLGTYIKPDFTAPGIEILSLGYGIYDYDWDEHEGWVPQYMWGYVYKPGTSMAAPHVAGTVALMLQANPDLTVDDVYGILMSTADDLGTSGQDTRYGWGVIDAYDAVTAARSLQKIIKPELEITKTVSSSTIFVGESTTVDVTANNVGNTAALYPDLEDTIPSGLTVVSGSTSASAFALWGTASPPSVDIYVHDTNTWINSSEARWCRVTQLDTNTWQYCFEDRKGSRFADYDFNQPRLCVHKEGDFCSVTLEEYSGGYLFDVYVGGALIWSNAGRALEQWGVGQTRLAPPVLLEIYVHETGETIRYNDAQWVKVTQIDANNWWYSFEDLKGSGDWIIDYDYEQPRLWVRRNADSSLTIKLESYAGSFNTDVYLVDGGYNKRQLWSNAGSHVGESVEIYGEDLRWYSVLPSLTYSYAVQGDQPGTYTITTDASSGTYTTSSGATIEVREGDAWIPGDAGNTISQARTVTAGGYGGYFGPDDSTDFYAVWAPSSLLKVEMTPGSDYDLYLYDSNQNLVAKSETRGSAAEEINYAAGQSSYYYVEVRKVSGSGAYNWSFTVTTFHEWEPLQPWSGAGWRYRIPIDVHESSGSDLEDYQVPVVVNTAAPIADGTMRPDAGDLRFSWQGLELPYWIESGVNTESTKVWVRVPLLNANSNQTIYAHYGNPGATSTASGDEVFEFFDDFEDGFGVGKWDFAGGRRPGVFRSSDGLALAYASDGGAVLPTGLGYPIPSDFAIEFDGYATPIGPWAYVGAAGRFEDSGNYFAYYVNDGQRAIQNYSSGVVKNQGYTWYEPALSAWHKFMATAVGTMHEFYIDGENYVSMEDSDHPSGRAGLWTYRANPTRWDNFRVRKYVEQGPTVIVWPAEGSWVNQITPYWRNSVPFTITATARHYSGVASVELFCRYSGDDTAWGNWVSFGVDTDGSDGWSWEFTAPQGDGYYEFYVIATDGEGNREAAPSVAEARAGVDRVAPSSKLYPIHDYLTGDLPVGIDGLLSAAATDDLSGVESVELWYRYRRDGGRPWPDENTLYALGEFRPDMGYWMWQQFQAQSYGYYEFYTVAVDKAGIRESVPSDADEVVRVAKDLVRMAVILAKPNDLENTNEHWYYNWQTRQGKYLATREYFERLAEDLRSYYDEVSYGALAFSNVDIYDKNGEWYKLQKSASEYRETVGSGNDVRTTYKKPDFLVDAVMAADSDIDYSEYDIIGVIGADPNRIIDMAHWWDGRWGWWDQLHADGLDITNLFVAGEDQDAYNWAHETGHGLGQLLVGETLPDLYPESPVSAGDVDGWGLMGYGWPAHLESWSKERLGWLEYAEHDLTQTAGYYHTYPLDALPTLHYGDQVPVYKADEWYELGLILPMLGDIDRKATWYLPEVRTNDSQYSNWDINLPIDGLASDGLVIYQIDETDALWGGHVWRTNVVQNLKTEHNHDYTLPGESYVSGIGYGVKFSALTPPLTHGIAVNVQYPYQAQDPVTFVMSPIPYEALLSEPTENVFSEPDLDLHAYTPDGRHVGMNYETGAYEVGIPGAIASGNLYQGTEWISIPNGVEAHFVVKSIGENELPEEIENLVGAYIVEIVNVDENGTYLFSRTFGGAVKPGESEAYTLAAEVKIENLAGGPFSPNGDGKKDTTTVSYSLIDNLWRQASVTIEIYNEDNTLVRRLFSGLENAGPEGTEHSHTWDGRDEHGRVAPDGIYAVIVKAKDGSNSSVRAEISITLDTTPPFTSHVLSGKPGEAGWWSSDVEVELNAADMLSEVASTKYRLDGRAWLDYTQPFMVAEGRHSLEYYSVDRLGVRETVKRVGIDIDKSPPTSSVEVLNYWQTKVPFVIAAVAGDDISGVENVGLWCRFSSDNLTWDDWALFGVDIGAPWSWSFDAIQGDGYYKFYSTATDAAGNVEDAPEDADVWICIDTTPPESSVVIPQYWQSTPHFIVDAQASDNLSGVKEVELWYRYSADNLDWSSWNSYGVDNGWPWSWSFDAPEENGFYKFGTIAVDQAGNLQSVEHVTLEGEFRGLHLWYPSGYSDWGWSEIEGDYMTGISEDGAGELVVTVYVENVGVYLDSYVVLSEPEISQDYEDGHGWISFDDVTLQSLGPAHEWNVFVDGVHGTAEVESWDSWREGEYEFGYRATYGGIVEANVRIIWPEATASVYVWGDETPPNSSIAPITPYWRNDNLVPFEVSATASDTQSGVENVELFYRHSPDNSSWGEWRPYGIRYGESSSWDFTAPDGDGFYEFCSVATDGAGNSEPLPDAVITAFKEDFNGETWNSLARQGWDSADGTSPSVVDGVLLVPHDSYPSKMLNVGPPFTVEAKVKSDVWAALYIAGIDELEVRPPADGVWHTVTIVATTPVDGLFEVRGYVDNELQYVEEDLDASWAKLTYITLYGPYSSGNAWFDNIVVYTQPKFTSYARCAVDTAPPVSSVNSISPYWQNASGLSATALDGLGVENVELWYRYSGDNVNWSDWKLESAKYNAGPSEEGLYKVSVTIVNPTGEDYAVSQGLSVQPTGKPTVYLGSVEVPAGENRTIESDAVFSSSDEIYVFLEDTVNVSSEKITFDGNNVEAIITLNYADGVWGAKFTALGPWAWSFTAPEGDGFYEFYSVATDWAGNREDAPSNADAVCGVDATLPASSVDQVTPYWHNASMAPFTVSAAASDATSGVKGVELYYTYSTDNSTWGPWASYGADNVAPWSWSFTAPNGDGYYQFYSIATDMVGNTEREISAGNWLAGWQQRRPVTISNGAEQLNDYQVRVEVPWGPGMLQDYGDIRFTSSDGTTLLPYWIESSDQSSAKVWVKVPLIPVGGTTVYLYYGNPSAASASSGTNTFMFFDDFSGNDWADRWTLENGTAPTEADGVISLPSSTSKSTAPWLSSKFAVPVDTVTHARFYAKPNIWATQQVFVTDSMMWYPDGSCYYSTNYNLNVVGYGMTYWVTTNFYTASASAPGQYVETARGTYTEGWKDVEMAWTGGSVAFKSPEGSWAYTQNVPAQGSALNIQLTGGRTVNEQYDLVYVRKFAPLEPTASVGGEQACVGAADAIAGFDTASPTTQHELSGTGGGAGWWREVNVSLSATDSLSGVDRTLYRIDNGAWQTYASPFAIGDGVHSVDYRSVDIAGNEETVKSVEIKIDTSPPVSTVNQIGSYWLNQVPFTITAAASDDPSGVASVGLWYRYSPDNSGWQKWALFNTDNDNSDGWSWRFDTPEGDGYYQFSSVATDLAGNAELIGPVFVDEFAGASLDAAAWAVGKEGVENDGVTVSYGRLQLTSGADTAGTYGTIYAVSKSTVDFSQGLVFDIPMSVPTDDAPGDFRSEFYLMPTFTTTANPHDQPDWLRVSASVDRDGVRWMLQRQHGASPGTLYTSGPTSKLSGTWRILIDSGKITVWLDDQLVESTMPHALPFTSAYVYLVERTNVAPVYTVSFDYVRAQRFSADISVGVDTIPPESSVIPAVSYWQNASTVPFTVTAAVSSDISGVASVELWYRYSADNVTWGQWSSFGARNAAPYEWLFNAPSGDGYYEFVSTAEDAAGNAEAVERAFAQTFADEFTGTSINTATWAAGRVGVTSDSTAVSDGKLKLTARAAKSGTYGALYAVSKTPFDFSRGMVFEVPMSVPTYSASEDFRSEFYLTPTYTTIANPNDQPNWLRVSASVNLQGATWMLQRRVGGGGIGTLGENEIIEFENEEIIDLLHMYTSGLTQKLSGTWRILIDNENITVWLDNQLVEPTRPHGMNFTSAYAYLCERTKISSVYTVAFDYLKAESLELAANVAAGIDTVPPASNANTVSPYWHNANVIPFEVTATASEQAPANGAVPSGLKQVELFYRYSADNQTWSEWSSYGVNNSAPWAWAFDSPRGDGYYEFYTASYDLAGNAEHASEQADARAGVDTAPPATQHELSGTAGSTGWWRSSVTVALTASDATSGVSQTLCRIDNGAWQTYASPFAIGDGVHSVDYRSVDIAGNEEVAKSFEVKVDSLPPATSSELSGTAGSAGWWISDATVILSSAENTSLTADVSGADYTEYRVDGGEWTRYSVPIVISGDGIHTVDYRSVDVAGNGETIKSIEVKIDAAPPVSSVNQIESCWQNSAPFTVSVTASDAPSGVASVGLYYRYSADNAAWGDWRSCGVDSGTSWSWEFTAPDGDGYYEFYSAATDAAGNAELHEQAFASVFADEFSGVSLDTATWSTGKVGVTLDNIGVSDGKLAMTSRAAKSGTYGAIYTVSNSTFDFSQGVMFEVQMSVPTDNAPADFRSEFYLTPTFTTTSNPHDQPNWLRVSASANRQGVTWMLQRRINGGGVGTLGEGEEIIEYENEELIDLLHMYTSGLTHKLSGTWQIFINNDNITVWLDDNLVEPTRPHGMSFTSAYAYLCERTNVAPVYTVTFDYVKMKVLAPAADAGAGLDTAPPSITITSPLEGAQYIARRDNIKIDFNVTDVLDPSPTVSAYLTDVEDGTRVDVTSGQSIDPLSIDGGFWTMTVEATDQAGNSSSLTTGQFEVIHDVQPPRTSITVGTPQYSGDRLYVTSATSFALSAVDDLIEVGDGTGLGVASTEYQIDNGTWTTYDLPFAISGDGPHTIYFRSTDVVGNAEETKSLAVVVDDTPPESSVVAPYPYWGDTVPFAVSADASDAFSGVASVELYYRSSTDGASWTEWKPSGTDDAAPYGWQFTAPDGPAVYEFYSVATDMLGNVEGPPEHADASCGTSILATVDIDPDTLNLKSNGRWITAYIELPSGYDLASVNIGTIALENVVPAEPRPTEICDHDGTSGLMVKFDRAAVQALVSVGDVKLTVTGKWHAVLFEGSDNIRVINPGQGQGCDNDQGNGDQNQEGGHGNGDQGDQGQCGDQGSSGSHGQDNQGGQDHGNQDNQCDQGQSHGSQGGQGDQGNGQGPPQTPSGQNDQGNQGEQGNGHDSSDQCDANQGQGNQGSQGNQNPGNEQGSSGGQASDNQSPAETPQEQDENQSPSDQDNQAQSGQGSQDSQAQGSQGDPQGQNGQGNGNQGDQSQGDSQGNSGNQGNGQSNGNQGNDNGQGNGNGNQGQGKGKK